MIDQPPPASSAAALAAATATFPTAALLNFCRAPPPTRRSSRRTAPPRARHESCRCVCRASAATPAPSPLGCTLWAVSTTLSPSSNQTAGSERKSWDLGRFVSTVIFFNAPPAPQDVVRSLLRGLTGGGVEQQQQLQQHQRQAPALERQPPMLPLCVPGGGGVVQDWGSLDDVVMGGCSASRFTISQGERRAAVSPCQLLVPFL